MQIEDWLRGSRKNECGRSGRWEGLGERQDEEGTHEWLNPSLETPSRRQDAHTFLSFSLQEKGSGHARGCGQRVRAEGQRSKRVGARLHVGVIRSPKASLCDAGGIKITQESERVRKKERELGAL